MQILMISAPSANSKHAVVSRPTNQLSARASAKEALRHVLTLAFGPVPLLALRSGIRYARVLCGLRLRGARALLFAVVAGVSTIVGTATLSAAPIAIVDQQQVFDNGQNTSNGLESRGQTFTPSLSSLNAVDVKLSGGLPGGTHDMFKVNIRQTDLSGALLGTSQTTTMPDDYTGFVTHFDFAAPVSLTPGNVYAIEIVPLALEGIGFTVRIALSDLYSGGVYYTGPSSPISSADMWFREGLSVPEPSTGVLAIIACGVIWSWRRRAK